MNKNTALRNSGRPAGLPPGKTLASTAPSLKEPDGKIKAYASAFDARQLPVPKETHSDYLIRTMGDKLLKENPQQSRQHINQNKNIYWAAFADWARDNVVQLKTTIYQYMADQNAWIFDFFPIVMTKSMRFQQTFFQVNNVLPNIGVRKVPFRNIHASVYHREANSIYTGQGFSMDYHFMKTPDGMVAWDRMVDALTANLWSFVIYQALHELVFEPEFYRKMNQLYPFDSMPRNVEELFDLENAKKFILNKMPQGQHELVSDSARIMLQKNTACTGLILSRDTMWYMHGRDPTQIFYDKSGPFSMQARTQAGQQKTLDGITLYPIPVAQRQLHDDYLEPLLEYTVQHGSFWRFQDECTDPKTYLSEHRSRRFASVSLNAMKKYTLLDLLYHVPEFYPLDNINDGPNGNETAYMEELMNRSLGVEEKLPGKLGDVRGKINKDALYGLINERDEIFRNRLKTKLQGNENKLNPLIRYVAGIGNNNRSEFYPIACYGEMPEESCKTKYLNNVAITMDRALFKGIDRQDMPKFERGLRLARELNSATNNLEITKMVKILGSVATNEYERMFGSSSGTVGYYRPSDQGGPAINTDLAKAATSEGAALLKPYGFGSIAGFLTLAVAEDTAGQELFDREMMTVIKEFIPIYRAVVDNLRRCCPDHPALSPKMIPYYNNSPAMDNYTRELIAAWYTLFMPFSTPIMIDNKLTQLTLDKIQTEGDSNKFRYAGLKPVADSNAPIGYSFIPIAMESNNVSRFEASEPNKFAGSIFTALPFINHQLPLLDRSTKGKTQRVRAIPENSGKDDYDEYMSKHFLAYDNMVYTPQMLSEHLDNEPVLEHFHPFIKHIIANPLVHGSTHSDFESRYVDSWGKQALLGVATRAVLLTNISLQSITAYFDSDIKIPFGAMAFRPHETQTAHCGIATADGQIGNTYFSGYDNTVSFDPNGQHYDVQAFCWMKTMVSQNHKYHMLPMIRGGNFLGGKGHQFVNEGTGVPINEDEQLIDDVSRCNGAKLGDRSIIAGLCSYNSACERQSRRYLDMRNTWRSENFSGRLTYSPNDFVSTSAELHFSCAPMLNFVFNWDNGESTERQDNMNFVQMMKRAAMNYHVAESVMDVFDPVKGWVRRKGHGVWGNTEVENCRQIQTSHASVVKAV